MQMARRRRVKAPGRRLFTTPRRCGSEPREIRLSAFCGGGVWLVSPVGLAGGRGGCCFGGWCGRGRCVGVVGGFCWRLLFWRWLFVRWRGRRGFGRTSGGWFRPFLAWWAFFQVGGLVDVVESWRTCHPVSKAGYRFSVRRSPRLGSNRRERNNNGSQSGGRSPWARRCKSRRRRIRVARTGGRHGTGLGRVASSANTAR